MKPPDNMITQFIYVDKPIKGTIDFEDRNVSPGERDFTASKIEQSIVQDNKSESKIAESEHSSLKQVKKKKKLKKMPIPPANKDE